MRAKVLVADDEVKLRELVKAYLEKDGYEVIEASTGKEALAKYDSADLAILDVMMPQGDGWLVCKEIRKNSGMPIIMLTARGEELDKLMGFDLGADDYVTKPFSPKELVARVKAVLKRLKVQNDSAKETLIFGDLEINNLARKVTCHGQVINLTPKEFDLLYFLAKEPGRVFSRKQLLEQVWGYDFYGDERTVDTHIKNIREKISQAVDTQKYIHTIWGVGYKFDDSIN